MSRLSTQQLAKQETSTFRLSELFFSNKKKTEVQQEVVKNKYCSMEILNEALKDRKLVPFVVQNEEFVKNVKLDNNFLRNSILFEGIMKFGTMPFVEHILIQVPKDVVFQRGFIENLFENTFFSASKNETLIDSVIIETSVHIEKMLQTQQGFSDVLHVVNNVEFQFLAQYSERVRKALLSFWDLINVRMLEVKDSINGLKKLSIPAPQETTVIVQPAPVELPQPTEKEPSSEPIETTESLLQELTKL